MSTVVVNPRALANRNRKALRKLGRIHRRRLRRGLLRYKPLSFVMPDSYVCKMRYVQEVELNPEPTASAVRVFKANCVYDPDNTLASDHQAMGFDQIMAFYNHFTVLSSKCRMTYYPKDTTTGYPCYYGITLTDGGDVIAGLGADIEAIVEQDKSTMPPLQAGTIAMSAPVSMYRGKVKTFSLKKFFKTKSTDEAEYKGSSASSPTEMAYFECWACPIQGQDAREVNFLVMIEYIVKFTGPRNLAKS